MYRKILILGPCRSGTTFVLNALSNDQYDGYFQICKSDVRKKLVEDAQDSDLLSVMGNSPLFVAKEALGPYFIEEVNIDPVAKILVPDDYEDALIIFCLREPDSCLLSWEKSFGNKKAINHQVFNQAYSQLKQLYENYNDKIRTAVLILDDKELFQERIGQVIRGMFPFEKKDEYSTYYKYRDPDCFEIKGLLDKAMSSKVYSEEKTKIYGEVNFPAIQSSISIYQFFLGVK
ncbi:hypothetical protein [Pantoea ananatis]|jgi:hypothetical protein|uniref:hypothetical protein n=1 Tax=Pantoea ananas TaxID=553 RepID=UPI001B3123BF|nr:hypothetical protein [Pantoea ananatis]